MTYSSFLVIAILLAIAPGPDTLVVLKNALAGGTRGGLMAALGIFFGNIAQGSIVALGLGVVITEFQPAFVALHWLGAAYLVYLGIQALLSARRGAYSAVGLVDASQTRLWRRFGEGLLSNVTNPKALVLYLSVLPQVLNAGTSLGSTLLFAYTLGTLGFVWQLVLLGFVHRTRQWLTRRKVRRAIDGVLGTALLGFGAALVLD